MKKLIGSMLVVLALLSVMSCNETIGPSERGVKIAWGVIEEEVLQPGFYWYGFGEDIEKYSIVPIEVTTDISIGADAAITRDNQSIGMLSVAYYRLKEEEIINIRKNFSKSQLSDIVRRSLIEAKKSEIGKYTIFELPTSQDLISVAVLSRLREMLVEYPIVVTEFKIQNFDWSDEFDAQIQQTVQRAEQVRRMEQEVLIARAEADKDVARATAQAQAVRATAQGELDASRLRAEAKVVEGEALRRYNEQIRATLDVERALRQLEIDKIRAEKWDGRQVPEQQVILPNGVSVAPATR